MQTCMLEYEEVEDPYIIEDFADAISNHIRVMILEILRKKKSITIGDLLRELEKKYSVRMTHGNVRVHLMKMAIKGIVELTKIDGKDGVILKKDIRIFVKEVEQNGK